MEALTSYFMRILSEIFQGFTFKEVSVVLLFCVFHSKDIKLILLNERL